MWDDFSPEKRVAFAGVVDESNKKKNKLFIPYLGPSELVDECGLSFGWNWLLVPDEADLAERRVFFPLVASRQDM